MNRVDIATLSGTLAIPSLCFRRWQDRNDYLQMAAVRSGSCEWDQVDLLSAREEVPTAEDLELAFPPLEVQDSPDLLVVEINQQIVGYNHVFWRWTEVTGTRVYLHLGYLLPEWRGKGIGSAMLSWAQQRIHELAAQEQPQGPTTFATNVSSTEREADALIQHAKYMAVRRLSDMMLEPLVELPTLTLPAGVMLRPIKPEHYRAIYHVWKSAFANMLTTTMESEEDYQEFVEDNMAGPSFDPSLCHVAWSDDAVVGFVLARIHKGVGMISEVAVHPRWQRRGIARSLMIFALNALCGHRMKQVRLFTNADKEQGARKLYESFGFCEVKQHIFYRKPFSV